MAEKSASDHDRIADTVHPDASGVADLDGASAEDAVDDQEAEVDQLAADADPTGLGHGPNQE